MTLRVVQVTFHPDPERRAPEALLAARFALVSSAIGAARAGVDVHVVQAAHESRTLDRDAVSFHFVDDVRAVPVRLTGPLRVPRRPSRIIERVVALAPQVVHVHGLNYPLAIRQLARALRGVPILAQDHGSAPLTGLRRNAQRWAFRPLAGVAFTAREQAAPFFDANVLPASLSVFEVLGGSSHFTPGDLAEARRATGMFGDPCVLWTGRLDANKDPLTMLEAMEIATEGMPGLRVWCCFGQTPLLEDVERRISSSPVLRDRVTLLGSRPHAAMENHFRAADFYVQTSHREASGFSLLEALACGTTPLVADIPATRRIVGDAGSLTPVGDSAALAAALVEWAKKPAASRRRLARARFDEALSFEAVGCQLRRTYEVLAR